MEEFIHSMGEKTFRAKQLYEWIHKKLVCSFDEMTNISKEFRASLDKKCTIESVRITNTEIKRWNTQIFNAAFRWQYS